MDADNLTSRSLLILLWNANGLLSRRTELDYFLHEKRIDVALITETHLTPSSYFSLPGYTCYRTDHPDGRAHGGAAILIRSQIQHSSHPGFQNSKIQSSTVFVHCSLFCLHISSVYCPPRHRITADEFSTFLDALGSRFIAGGDFNAKNQIWGSRTNNPKGRSLWRAAQNSQSSIITPNSPTYWPNSLRKLPDLLDIFVCRGVSSYDSLCESFSDLSSDHSPVLLTISASPIHRERNPILIPSLIDLGKFRDELSDKIDLNVRLKSVDDLEDAVEHFTRSVQQAAWSSPLPPRNIQPRGRPTYPLYIRELIRERRRARKRWQNFRLPSLRADFNRLNNYLKNVIRKFNSDVYQRRLEALTSTGDSFWSQTKRILRDKEVSQPLKKDDGTWAISNEDKAELFALHLSTTFQPHTGIQDLQNDLIVSEFVSSPLPVSLPPKAFSPGEVQAEIKRLPCKKSPGHDLITNEILKELPKKGILFLTYILNSILRLSHFPLQWKLSEIKMVLKPGKSAFIPSSYRPISLLPNCSKLFERLLIKRLHSFTPFHEAMPDHQFGFRPSHSTIMQLHRVTDYICSNLEQKKYTLGAFIDVSQAFDRVWHEGLLFKLKSLLPSPYFLILKSFLADRFFRVRCESDHSIMYPILAGVPQGSVLSPTLFNIYTSDVPLAANTLTATYADDTVILSCNEDPIIASRELQNHMNDVFDWCTRWKIKLNSAKSSLTTFTLRHGQCPPVHLNNEELARTDVVRYLGVHLDKRLTWTKHIKFKRKLLDMRLKKLYRLIGHHSKLSTRLKLTIYNYLLKPIWLYGSQIFGAAKPSNINIIQRFQSKVLRIIAGCPSYVSNLTLHTDFHTPYVLPEIKRLYRRFYNNLERSENQLIKLLHTPNLPGNPTRRLKRRWSRDLLI
jgi:hypothetical protein